MNKAQIAFASATLMFLLPSAASSQVQTSSHKIRGSSCVNFRAEPSINAPVVNCLQPGTNVQVFRLPPTGRFVWVSDREGRTWYKASVPGTNAVGWIMPACTDIFGNTKTEACTDYGSVAQNPGTQEQNSPANTSVAQNTRREEVLKNPNWQVVPGARVGKNPADTLININNLNRKENAITFDITGYQSFYYRLQGDCSTRQVRFLRRGTLGTRDTVNYQLVEGEEATKVFELHRAVLDFACRQSNTQIATSSAGSSPSISSSPPSIVTPPRKEPSTSQSPSQPQPPSTPQPSSKPPSPSNQPPSTPVSPRIFQVPPQTKPAVWIGRSHESYPDANGACQSWAKFYEIPTNEIGIKPLHLNEDQSQEVYMAICYRGNPDNSFAPVDVDCSPEVGENYTAYYEYTGGTNGKCVLVKSVATTPPPASTPVSQTPHQTREPSPSPTPTPPSGEPQNRREPTPSPTPTPTPQVNQTATPSNPLSSSTPASSEGRSSERGKDTPPCKNANDAAITAAGFKLFQHANGVCLYSSKASGSNNYVTVVDLNKAKLRSILAPKNKKSGAFIYKRSRYFWDEAEQRNTNDSRVVAIVNGSFFDVNDEGYPYMGIKSDGIVVAEPKFKTPGYIVAFCFDSSKNTAFFRNDLLEAFKDKKVPNSIGLLSLEAPNFDLELKKRTLVGIRDNKVFFLSSDSITKSEAQKTLIDFGAITIAQLDGGESELLMWNNEPLLRGNRFLVAGIYGGIPATIAIYSYNDNSQ